MYLVPSSNLYHMGTNARGLVGASCLRNILPTLPFGLERPQNDQKMQETHNANRRIVDWRFESNNISPHFPCLEDPVKALCEVAKIRVWL